MTTDGVVLDDIPFQINLAALLKKLRIKEGSGYVEQVTRMAEDAKAIARPKAYYRMAFVESKGDASVTIDGITFDSRVLRVNMDQAYRAFPYVATCGQEMEEWADTFSDMLERYWADTIKEMALRNAINVLRVRMIERYRLARTSTMAPGSLADWPLTQQRPLFDLLGRVRELIGVQLTDSLLMIPTKSASGIRFPMEESFESCKLCPREVCPGRRAPYDAGLYERKYKPIPSAT